MLSCMVFAHAICVLSAFLLRTEVRLMLLSDFICNSLKFLSLNSDGGLEPQSFQLWQSTLAFNILIRNTVS